MLCGALVLALGGSAVAAPAAATQPWAQVLARARGETVYFDAWGGDAKTNDFIAWVGREVRQCCGVTLREVPLADTSEAVTQVIAEKSAGRDADGTIDLIWINGPNFLALKSRGLLYGPFANTLPNAARVDTRIPSNVDDFTVPVAGYESPWRRAQLVLVYDSAYVSAAPRTIADLPAWVRRYPGRFTFPGVPNFLGVAFLEQALYAFVPDRTVLAHPVSEGQFRVLTRPLWAWFDRLRPYLWRHGEAFPASGPAERQLLADGEIDMMPSFNPAGAAVDVAAGRLPPSVRTAVFAGGTLGNTSFVAIPFNAPHQAAARVVANFLLSPRAQARAADIRYLGDATVLDLAKLTPAQRARFKALPRSAALPPPGSLREVLPEPNPWWGAQLVRAFERRYTP